MKNSVVILFVVISLLSFNYRVLNAQTNPENGKLTASPTPPDVLCFGETYRPKSEDLVASMTTRQLIDELIKIRPAAFRTYEELDGYQKSIEERIRQAEGEALPVFTEYMNNSYQNRSDFYCDKLRFDTVTRIAHDIDRFEFRLRGTTNGQLTIDAFERAVERVEKPGFTEKDVTYYRPMFLNQLKGLSHIDQNIQDTFWVRYRIEISEEELLEFTNFLIELDPTYPSWSDTDFIKDNSRINTAGYPRQVYVMKKPERFYEAYLDFKETKCY